MASNVIIYKGIKHVVTASGLSLQMEEIDASTGMPNGNMVDAKYYAVLRNETDGKFISTDLTDVTPDNSEEGKGACVFVFGYKQTAFMPEGNVSIQIFDKNRNSLAYSSSYAVIRKTGL